MMMMITATTSASWCLQKWSYYWFLAQGIVQGIPWNFSNGNVCVCVCVDLPLQLYGLLAVIAAKMKEEEEEASLVSCVFELLLLFYLQEFFGA